MEVDEREREKEGKKNFLKKNPKKKNIHLTVLEAQRQDTLAFSTGLIHNQIQRKVLDEELAVVPHRLAVQRVEHSMSRPVCRSGTPISLATFAEIERLPTEGTLVDLPFVGAGERKAVVLELDDGGRGLAAHVLDGVLVL